MSLLDFARGPGMQYALLMFVLGTFWRVVGVAFLKPGKDLSAPRRTASWTGIRAVATRLWPRREFLEGSGAFNLVTGYVFHIGFLLVVFFYVPHVLFFTDLFRGLAGGHLRVTWPALPTSVVSVLAVVALAALVGLLFHRLTNPVKRLISNLDDYFSWLLTAAPLATGLMAYGHIAGIRYDTLLGLHLLTVEALIAWFPWGKLMHAITVFASRATTGVLFERKGAAL